MDKNLKFKDKIRKYCYFLSVLYLLYFGRKEDCRELYKRLQI